MARTVVCRKYQEEMEGLEAPPFPGSKGQDIYENVSKQAWEEWQHHQTMLINENHLNMMEKASRRYLEEQRERFFRNEPFERPEGYVPPST